MKQKVDNAIIMAAGLSSRFVPMSIDDPKGLMVVKGEVLIERLIRQLKEKNIHDIIIVTGYQADKFEYLIEKFNATIVYNPEFETRNNHSSLYYAQDYLKNSLICSSDNYYTENVFSEFEEGAYYSTIFSEGETDEWVVRSDAEGFINYVKIGGSNADYMIGHAFFDEVFSNQFKTILNEKYNSVEIVNMLWESVYKEHLDVLKMRIKRHESHQILEFDSLRELKQFDPWYKNHTNSPILMKIVNELDTEVKKIKKVKPILSDKKLIGFSFKVKKNKYKYMIEKDLLFDSSKIISGESISSIKEVIETQLEDGKNIKIHGIYKLGGLTNNNYLVKYNKKKKVVFRLPGEGSNKLINRYDEALNMEAALIAGIDAEVLYFDSELGIKITKYIENSQTLSTESFNKDKILRKTAKLLKNLHHQNIDMPVHFDVYGKIDYYENLIKSEVDVPFKDYERIRTIVFDLRNEINELYTFSHNDPLPENFILSKDKLTLIDWEYAGMNHPYWDVAAVIVETKFKKSKELKFIEYYFDRKPSQGELRQIQIQKILIDFLWSLWGVYFSMKGKDYMQYALDRYEYCLKSIEELR